MNASELKINRITRIGLVLKKALEIDEKEDYKGTIADKNNFRGFLPKLEREEYFKLSTDCEKIIIAKYYADKAIPDIKKGIYSERTKNFISQFVSIFIEKGKDHSKIL